MNVNRCRTILDGIQDNINAIFAELHSNHQEGYYLLEKIEPIEHDVEVLKNEFIALKEKQDKERS